MKEDKARVWAKFNTLVMKRTEARSCGYRLATEKLSKDIQKETKAIARAVKKAKAEKILTEYKDIKKLANLKAREKKMKICAMKDKDG